MKKSIFYFLLFMLGVVELTAQQTNQPYPWREAMAEPTANYYDIYDAAMAHFDTVPDDPLRKTFGRWNAFWSNRHGGDGDNGTFVPAYRSLYNVFTGLEPICNDSPVDFEQWESLGPSVLPPAQAVSNGLGIVTKVKVDLINDPSGNTVYAGTNASGLWKTTNALVTASQVEWAPFPENNSIPALGVHDIDIDSEGNLFVATGYEARLNNTYGLGLIKYDLITEAWVETGLTITPNKLDRSYALDIFHFENQDDYILVSLENEVHISRDNGETFELVTENLDAPPPDIAFRRHFFDVTFHPTNADIFYATLDDYSSQYGGAEFYRFEYLGNSTYNEMEVTPTGLNLPSGVAPVKIDITIQNDFPDYVYAVISDANGTSTNGAGVFYSMSTDMGTTWTPSPVFTINVNNFGAAWSMNDLVVSPLDENIILKGGVDIWALNTNNSIFSLITDSYNVLTDPHPDTRDLEIAAVPDPNNPIQFIEVVYWGHDGGIARSFTSGQTNEDISRGLNIAQFYGFDVAEDYSYLVGGCQDLSFLWYNLSTNEWRNPELNGDGLNTEIDQYDNNFIFGQSHTSFLESNSIGFPGSFGGVTNPPPFDNQNGRNLPMLSHENGQLYVGSDNIYVRNRISGNFGSAIGNGPNAGLVRGMAISKDANTIYMSMAGYWIGDPFGPGGFWVSNNANDGSNANWINLTSTCTPFTHGMINTIAMHPYETEKIWVGINRFVNGRKVFYSSDGGNSWFNLSAGLPNFPINCLVYHEGADVLYVGTDIGVYYLNDPDNTSSTWQCLNDGLPTCIVMDLEINYCENKLLAATYGRSIWELNLPIPEDETAREITENTVWGPNTFHTLNTDLVIRSGATLEVNGEVHIAKRKKIIVEPNARLKVDGGKLTNLCQGPWEGIVVMGDKFSPQTQSGDLFTHQGFVELDDAVVENAADAIRLWNPYDYNSSGGVVQATRTDFINNARSVEFIDYQNFYVAPNGKVVLVGNASKFDLCQFMTTPDYDAVGHSGLPIPHVTMWRVGNIPYKGCTFNNTHGSLGLGGIGISALDAQFTVTEFVHGGGTTYSGFDGLRYGIRSLYVNSPSTYLVHEAKFSNNLIGIYNSGVDNPRVTHCSFNVGFVASDPRPNYGIYLNGGTGYIIEENTFNGNAGSSTQSIGIVARETGNELNVIYKNNFNDMTYANLSNGDNTGGSTPEADAFGLKYECNVNDLSAYDFAVPLENLLPFGVSGVQSGPEEQGTPLAAGNNFTDVASGALVSQFFNLGLPLTYHADVNIPEEVPTATIGISSIDPAPNNSCESHLFTVRDTRLTESEREIVEQEFNTKIQGLNSLSQNLNALIDDGDTQGLINTINNATSSNAAQVKNQLLAISPYLGQPVLMATADQSPAPFSHNDLYKICKANPDELKPTLLDYMDSKTNPLPGNLIDSLQNYIGQTTPRSDTLAAMSGYAVAAYNAANLLINDLLLDSTNYDMTRLRNWWTSKATLAADYTLIDSYIQEQDTSKAKQVSNSLPSKYNLTGAILTDYNNHLLLREIEIELISEGRNWNNLTNDEINILINIAEDDIGRTGKCAQNVLSFYYGFDYFREAILPAPPPQSMTLPDQTIAPGKDQKEIVQWLAYPNPATNEVFIEYSLPNDVKNPVLLISDANGKVVLQQGLDIKLDKFIWNTSDHKDGMYFYTLRFNDQMQQTKQLLLMK